jgi:hypothetical protein
MSANQNPVVHPDENLLAAFAEKALTGAQRESVLSHLSGCARCRNIVFLAQESAAQPQAVPQIPELPARRRWMRWQAATAVAWVLALLVGAALLWHRRENAPPPNEQAIVHPSAPPALAPPQKNAQEQAAPAMPIAPIRQAVTGQMAAELKSPETRKKSVAQLSKELPQAAPEAEMRAQSFIAPPAGAPEQQAAIAHSELRSILVPRREPVPQPTEQVTVQQSPAAAKLAPAPPPGIVTASNQLAATQSVTVSVSSQAPAPSVSAGPQISVSSGLPQFSIKKGKLERLDAGGYKAVALPAGTQARSVAAYANVILVLTKQRTLYRSIDSGEHWSPVPAQWNGKAAVLRLRMAAAQTSPQKPGAERGYGAMESERAKIEAGSAGALRADTLNAAPQLEQPAQKPTPPMPRADFELTNGAGKRWLSRDGGQSWQPE